ncbi:YgeY family selenium metabolism-linked hydrolase [bacterium]|nr:YgeY family selenium metabolism-linked hydrolase [bacterium]
MRKNYVAEASRLADFTAETLSRIVKIKSLSCGEEHVIRELKDILEASGVCNCKIDGLGNLVACMGHGPRIIAIDAHIDTVDTGNLCQWNWDPFSGEITDSQVRGRGTTDQKGGAASMVTAARMLAEVEDELPFKMVFTFTVMEEDCDGLCWDYMIEKEGLIPDFAVITEPTNLALYRGHRGRMEMEILIKGISAHGSAPERGVNAAYIASKIALDIEKLNERLATDNFLGKGTVAVTQIRSESPSLCAVPDICRMHLDRRITWGETKKSALSEVSELLPKEASVEVPLYNKKSYTGVSHPILAYFPSWKTPIDHPLTKGGISAASVVLGHLPIVDKWVFSTNGVSIAGRHGIPTIGFGPGNETAAHAPNETTSREHLNIAAAFYAELPFHLTKEL